MASHTALYDVNDLRYQMYRIKKGDVDFGQLPPCKLNAPVICFSGPLGAGDTRVIAGIKCRDLTSDWPRQCGRCAGVLISRQNIRLCHMLTTKIRISLCICTV